MEKSGFTLRAVIVAVALTIFPIQGSMDSVEDALLPENHELSFCLFQIATLTFVLSASLDKEKRKFMGIKKGLFS